MKKADKFGLSAIAITDHDTVNGVIAAQKTASKFKVQLIPGIELTCHDGEQEIHLLGLDIDPNHELIIEHTERYRKVRYDRAIEIYRLLRKSGLEFDFEHILIEAGKGVIGRPHFAQVLIKLGLVSNIGHAFAKYLGDGGLAYVPKENFPFEDAIAMVHKINGISSVAHPANFLNESLIIRMIKAGMDGIEVTHPIHNPQQRSFYHRIAKNYGLIETGGSDYHGSREGDESQFGKSMVPMSVIESIRYRKNSRM